MLALVSAPRAEEEPVAVLVGRARDGDKKALQTLYVRHAAAVRALLARVLGVSGEVDDAVQETFLRAFRDLSALREPAAFSGFVRAVAVGVARRALRTRARRRWLAYFAPSDLPEAQAWTSASGDEDAWDTVKATYAILRTFPVEERLAFTLRHLHGMQLDETAAALDVSLATVKRRLQKAEDRFAAASSSHPALAAMFARDPK